MHIQKVMSPGQSLEMTVILHLHYDGSPHVLYLPQIPGFAKFAVLYIALCYSFGIIGISAVYMIPILAPRSWQFEKM